MKYYYSTKERSRCTLHAKVYIHQYSINCRTTPNLQLSLVLVPCLRSIFPNKINDSELYTCTAYMVMNRY